MSASPKRRKRPAEWAGRDQEEQVCMRYTMKLLCTNFKTQMIDTSATWLSRRRLIRLNP